MVHTAVGGYGCGVEVNRGAIGQFYIELQGCHLGSIGEIDWHGDNLSAHSAHVLYTKFVDILSLHIGEAQHA